MLENRLKEPEPRKTVWNESSRRLYRMMFGEPLVLADTQTSSEEISPAYLRMLAEGAPIEGSYTVNGTIPVRTERRAVEHYVVYVEHVDSRNGRKEVKYVVNSA